jgi:PAS domain S-box-containing protein
MKITGIWFKFLKPYLAEEGNPSLGRRIKFAVGFTVIGIITQMAFGILRLWQGYLLYAAADFILAVYLSTILFLLGMFRRSSLFIPLGVGGLFVFLVFLFASGGADGLGLLWLYFFPVTAFFLCGRAGGLKWMGLLFLAFIALYVLQAVGLLSLHHSFLKCIQIISSLMVEAAMVYYYAYVTEKDEDFIAASNESLSRANQMLENEMAQRHKAEEELLRISKAVRSLSDAVIIADPEGQHIFHNRSFYEMFGYTLEEMNRAGGASFLFRDPAAGNRMIGDLRQGRGFAGEVEMHNKEGRLMVVSLRADAIKDGEGKTVGLVAIHTDVTRHKQAEQALRESEERFRQVISSISAHIYVTKFTADGKPANDYISPNVEQLTGYPLPRFLTDWNFWAGQLILEEDRELGRTQVGRFQRGLSSEVEYRVRCKDGSIIWVRDSGRVVPDSGGKGFTVYGVISDITEHKQAEQSISESEIKHRMLLNSISLPVLALKDDMSVFYCNRAYAKFVDKSMAELEGKDLLELFPQIKESKTYQTYQKVFDTGLSQSVEGPYRDRFIHSDIYRTPWGILAIAEDITERKQAEEALWHAKEDLEIRVEERTKELAEANRRLTQSYNDTIKAITAAMDAKDSYTRGHSEEVKRIAVNIGRAMRLEENAIRRLEYAALLHDIGKIGVSDQLLTKETPLTDYEFEEVKLHPQIGGRLLEQVELLKEAGPIITAHHENFDGGGYPKGLKGEGIPIESRIIAVADAYEAMTMDRPYRKAYSKEEALARLKRGAGTQFDPQIVEVFMKTIQL